ncbi:DNA-binding protein [Steroidobacter agaridevorans]|uniref:DNA-binding protein n=1 Tax=Steroidobacter agaridevorans TaxID=2695856 RepID=A0A829YEH9_9GAMM|nr:ORF6N domain-containing protein [Steroidobacter agaridevorans]GFE81036.1 DNA-binding protein [Steroidobacter agaridevorans]
MTSKEANTRGIGLTKNAALISVEHVAQSIFILRGQRVLLDSELAALYQVPTKRLNEQVKRNLDRFPEDFMFRLSRPEVDVLNRSQIATGSQKHRDPRYPPYAFTEHGAIMAATILNSQRAIEMSIYVVRAFVQLRDLLASNHQLAEKFAELERKVSSHDQAIVGILKAIRELMHTPEPKTRPIGMTANLDE